MLKKIDLFFSHDWKTQYSVLVHFTQKLHEAFLSLGIRSRLIDLNNPAQFKMYSEDPPECSFSFNVVGKKDGKFIWDTLQIPHVASLVDLPHRFLDLTWSPYSIITCMDRSAVGFVRASGFTNVLFFPHSVESSVKTNPETPREHDVVLLSTCIDFEDVRRSWKEKFTTSLCEVMDEAAEITLSDQTTPLYQAFVQAMDSNPVRRANIDPITLNGIDIFNELEYYVRGKDRVELIKAITDAKVDVYSSAKGTHSWEKYVGNKSNVIIHPEVPFEEALKIMQHSKIVLNSCPTIKQGGHERIFSGLQCGALVLTSENPYLLEQFQEDASIAFYRHQHWNEVNQIIDTYLSDPSKRIEVAKKGQEIVNKFHTWEHRARQLAGELAPIIEKIGPRK